MTEENKQYIFYFDLDGVFAKECGVAEIGYAFILKFLFSDPITFNIKDEFVSKDANEIEKSLKNYLEYAKKWRPDVKGKHPVEKVKFFCEKSESKYKCITEDVIRRNKFLKRELSYEENGIYYIDPIYIAKNVWVEFQRHYIEIKFIKNNLDYRIPNSEEILKHLKEKTEVKKIIAVTANEQKQAEWLIKFIKLEGYFDEIYGYKLTEAFKSKDMIISKSINKIENPQKHNFKYIFVGDGLSDMEAAAKAGIYGIGVSSQNLNVQNNLIKAGANSIYISEQPFEKFKEAVQEALKKPRFEQKWI